MKKALIFTVFIVLALLISGCTTVPGESSTAVPEIPDIIGNWSGPMYGYLEGTGYTTFSNETITMSVTEQHGRIFSGVITFSNVVKSWEDKRFAGVIDRDGKTLTVIEGGSGISSGTIIAPDEIELTYLGTGEPFSVAIDSLKRD